MLDIEYYISNIKNKLNDKRFNHSLRVAKEAKRMAKIFNVNPQIAEVAGILHDYAKNLSSDEIREYLKAMPQLVDETMLEIPELAHGIVGAEIVKDNLYIKDKDILNSISFHTTGRKEMSQLEKIIYIADYIEPKRNFPGVEDVRKMAYKNLDKALLMALDNTIKFLIDRGAVIHPLSIEARNYYLQYLEGNS